MNSFESFQHVHVHILPRRPKDFKENDQIYDELNNHDKGPNVNWRQEEDMKKEASELRLFFATLWKMPFVFFIFNNALTVQKL